MPSPGIHYVTLVRRTITCPLAPAQWRHTHMRAGGAGQDHVPRHAIVKPRIARADPNGCAVIPFGCLVAPLHSLYSATKGLSDAVTLEPP